MSSAARKHHVDVQAHDLDNAEATEYATRGAHARRHARPDLKLVSPLRADKASRGVFALLIAGILGAGLVVMLVINTSLAQGAFTVTSLQQQKTALTIQAQALSSQVDAMSTPANLAARATALGMHPPAPALSCRRDTTRQLLMLPRPMGRPARQPPVAGGR